MKNLFWREGRRFLDLLKRPEISYTYLNKNLYILRTTVKNTYVDAHAGDVL